MDRPLAGHAGRRRHTTDVREYLIRRFLRPAWGDSPLNSLTTEAVTKWENRLPTQTGISRRTPRDARSLLCTILGDAAAARPPLNPYNPALRPRNRGRRTGRKLDLAPQPAWPTPLEALLLAERAALLSGRDEEFTMLVTIAYTGLRWGEAIGLEHTYARLGEAWVEWQMREVNGVFHRLAPKDDSYRSPNWEPRLPVDRPPFLDDLLAAQVRSQPREKCACASQHGGSGRYVFTSPASGPHGLRHGHRTWMAEDGILEILAEQRLGHQVPGMRGLYAHVSDRMRADLKAALQARWQESLRDRAAIHPRSPVSLLDQFLAPLRGPAEAQDPVTPVTNQCPEAPAGTSHHREEREKMISQIPFTTPKNPPQRLG